MLTVEKSTRTRNQFENQNEFTLNPAFQDMHIVKTSENEKKDECKRIRSRKDSGAIEILKILDKEGKNYVTKYDFQKLVGNIG